MDARRRQAATTASVLSATKRWRWRPACSPPGWRWRAAPRPKSRSRCRNAPAAHLVPLTILPASTMPSAMRRSTAPMPACCWSSPALARQDQHAGPPRCPSAGRRRRPGRSCCFTFAPRRRRDDPPRPAHRRYISPRYARLAQVVSVGRHFQRQRFRACWRKFAGRIGDPGHDPATGKIPPTLINLVRHGWALSAKTRRFR